MSSSSIKLNSESTTADIPSISIDVDTMLSEPIDFLKEG